MSIKQNIVPIIVGLTLIYYIGYQVLPSHIVNNDAKNNISDMLYNYYLTIRNVIILAIFTTKMKLYELNIAVWLLISSFLILSGIATTITIGLSSLYYAFNAVQKNNCPNHPKNWRDTSKRHKGNDKIITTPSTSNSSSSNSWVNSQKPQNNNKSNNDIVVIDWWAPVYPIYWIIEPITWIMPVNRVTVT
jgi:hypothetical protein